MDATDVLGRWQYGAASLTVIRPSVRPAHHLYQQPNFQFPTRPTNTAGSEALLAENVEVDNHRDSIWTYQSRSTTSLRERNSTLRPSQHVRAYSHSTIDEHAVQDWDVGAFRVVIDRPNANGRPRTSNGTRADFPTLEVPIPSYKIGTPRFSVRGTPFIRGSSYAPTEADDRTSIISRSQREPSFMGRSRDSRSFHPANPFQSRHSIAASHPADPASMFELRLPPTGLSGKAPNLMPRQDIVPEMFDSISTFPMCEDRSVIRRNPAGQISAATPARLIVEVTQELNYELVASVFITYRSYITASDLLSLVMARLQHGINQGDKGLVVTVRCFTVVRHWLVNFFIDDYVLDYSLRVEFCDLVNHMVEKHAVMMTNSKTTNDILSNIKRLWRDSCSTYWDGPEFDVDSDALVPISPGGVAGSRDPKLIPEIFADFLLSKTPKLELGAMSRLSRPPILELDLENSANISTQRFLASVPLELSTEYDRNTNHGASPQRGHRLRPSLPERPLSPRSIESVEAFSCSFPLKTGHLASAAGIGAHPVPTSSIATSSPIVRAAEPMRSSSQRGLRRNRSVSNSSRPERPWSADADNPTTTDHELYFTDRFAGSLIRGLVFLPPETYLSANEIWTSRPSSAPNKSDNSTKLEPSHSGAGMKKMFGTVRRAVNKSEGGDKLHPTSFPHLSVALEHTAAIGCATGAAVVKHCFRGPSKGMTMRPDKLSQFVERDFEAAVEHHRAELAISEERTNSDDGLSFTRPQDKLLAPTEGSPSEPLQKSTLASKSQHQSPEIESFPEMVANGGNPNNASVMPLLSQAPPASPLVETAWQVSVPPNPPVTPPERCQGTSQRLGDYGALTVERTPSLVLGLRSPASDLDSQPSFRPLKHPSTRATQKERKGSHSTSLRRVVSFHSGYTRQMTERSFDATTFSDIADRASMGSTHLPENRVLRRRPGGDLRAVNRVNDLPIRRFRSSGSLSTYSASLRSSFMLGSTESAGYLNVGESAQDESRPFSVGGLAEPDGTSKSHISLCSTESKPVMRPSFQAEAAKLAEIPDDADDDGGVESALLKLEGKYEQRKSQTSTQGFTEDFTASSEVEFERMFDQTGEDTSTETEKHLPRHSHALNTLSMHNEKTPSEPKMYVDDTTPTADSKGSLSLQNRMYNDIPLLQRDSEFSNYQPQSMGWTQTSAAPAPSLRMTSSQHSYSPSQESIDIINKTDSMNNIASGETLPRHFSAKGSYIEVDHDHSDLSSEMSMDIISSPDFSGSAFLNKPSPYEHGKRITELQISQSEDSHDRGLTMQQALGLLPSRDTFPPTPQGTPTIPPPHSGSAMRSWYSGNQPDRAEKPNVDDQLHADGAQIINEHFPFILSFPSSLLAQQFTLIEMEALSEIHFRELLEMKWSHDAASSCRSWPKFLQKLSKVEEDDSVSHGIEICAARSSIMTSWAISQVVLTAKLEERAKTVAKLIHIANECRKLGNYATLFQLTVALTNPLLTELKQTWAHVPAADVTVLRDLEELIQPANNFRRLRDEMESVLGKRACIPLVAIYAKDLRALKDMPSYISSTLSEPPLINVTKCKAQATVVQLVARYLEKSSELRINPVQGVVDRCLWVGGLRDAEVKECARGLV